MIMMMMMLLMMVMMMMMIMMMLMMMLAPMMMAMLITMVTLFMMGPGLTPTNPRPHQIGRVRIRRFSDVWSPAACRVPREIDLADSGPRQPPKVPRRGVWARRVPGTLGKSILPRLVSSSSTPVGHSKRFPMEIPAESRMKVPMEIPVALPSEIPVGMKVLQR